ncbi:DUF2711 family protein [Fredinandcohnia sp. 179-A 10B2 NHS]|uniref:DUF2711 family protein n=1 Tax=Fredinandcohnia sp. 179-A 10B2 NHS TaxID=3235176 RepID=UPI00399FA22D
MFYPLEDQISVLIIHDILSILASNGAKSIKYATLFGEQGTYNINEITPENITSLCSGLITITDEKEDFVFTCYFDEVSMLFFAKEDCRELLAKTMLEGIIFDVKTPLVWEDDDFLLIR